MLTDEMKQLFLTKYKEFGGEKFYKFILNYAVAKIATNDEVTVKSSSAEIELLHFHVKFLLYYRRENNDQYLEMAKIFRKAAHKLYRILIKKNSINKNNRFLNVVG